MPKWGLTNQLRARHPWGLDPDDLLAHKTITNSVQGDVYLNRLETMFVDSVPMQHLRRVKQLGNTHLVYLDATHSRFSHSLGALRAVQDLLDAVLDQENRPKPQPDLFQEWRQTLDEPTRLKQVAEVIVLARLGALLHDICHVPYGHTIEDDLGLLDKHDRNAARFDAIWNELPTELVGKISDELKSELRRLILSKEQRPKHTPSKYRFVEDLVGNTICADLLDYLRRDHQNLGLPFALGHRFLEGLYVTPSSHPHHKARVAIEVIRAGKERADVVSELLKVLRYRYEESERALVHHAKLAPDAMIGKLLAMWRDALWVDGATDAFGSIKPAQQRDIDVLKNWISQQPPPTLASPLKRLGAQHEPKTSDSISRAIDGRVRQQIEAAFRRHGDEGLLEHLAYPTAPKKSDSRREAIAALAQGVLNRELYKRVARSRPDDRHLAQSIWDQHGGPDARRRLEVEVSEFLGLPERWHVVLWIPHHEMKLKLALVNVGGGDDVTTLHKHSPKVQEIYDSHERLWAVGVYAHPSVAEDHLRMDVLRAWTKKRLGLSGWVGFPFDETVEEAAARHFAVRNDLRESEKEQLLAGVSGMMEEKKPSLAAILERFEATIA